MFKFNISSKQSKAFTLIEVGIVLVIIGVLSALTMTVLFGNQKTNLRKTSAYSSYFYTNISNAFQGVLSKYTTNYTLEHLLDNNKDDKIDSTDLAAYFAQLADGEILVANQGEESEDGGESESTPVPGEEGTGAGSAGEGEQQPEDSEEAAFVKHGGGCGGLLIASKSLVAEYGKNAACVDFDRFVAGFVYDQTCTTKVLTKEYLSKDDVDKIADNPDYEPEHREIENACGYVIYSLNGGKGEFKKDLFTIPFGKRTIK